MPRIVHFDLPADQPARAIDFYAKVFGWKITKWDGPEDYWLIETGPDSEPGINGGLSRRRPESAMHNTIGVDSVDRYVSRISEWGGKILAPKMVIPGVGYFARCEDTEGNAFGILEPDSQAR